MSKIWKVEVMYSDYESSQILTIGLFTDESKAEEVARKWETFHTTYSKLLEVPDNWNPTSDEWHDYSNSDEYTFEWEDSHQYQVLSMKYDKVKEFDEVIITEFELDKDMFSSQINDLSIRATEPFKQIVKEFERDYKLNNLLK